MNWLILNVNTCEGPYGVVFWAEFTLQNSAAHIRHPWASATSAVEPITMSVYNKLWAGNPCIMNELFFIMLF